MNNDTPDPEALPVVRRPYTKPVVTFGGQIEPTLQFGSPPPPPSPLPFPLPKRRSD